MIKPASNNANPTGLARWQKLLFPTQALMYHESTRQQIMSHVNLRRRSARHYDRSEQQEEEEKQEIDPTDGVTVTSLTDELNQSDINVNELLISEFKLMNIQMRREIRSLYRLLLIFVVIVIGMAVK